MSPIARDQGLWRRAAACAMSGGMRRDERRDPFLSQYLRGISHHLGPDGGPDSPGPMLAPAEPFALGGLLILEGEADYYIEDVPHRMTA